MIASDLKPNVHVSAASFGNRPQPAIGRIRIPWRIQIGIAFFLSAASFAFGADSSVSGAKLVFSIASPEAARTVLGAHDDFSSALSRFDRAARMKTVADTTERDFLAFARTNAIPWSAEETNRLANILEVVQKKVAPFNLPAPATILLIQTSGREEANASYTRQNAIILPQETVNRDRDLADTVLHEVFHVISRHSPKLRKQLYGIIGFSRINDVAYPEEIRDRKITNPDGVDDGWRITVTTRSESISTIPVLFASAAQYDPQTGGNFFKYIVFELLAVTDTGGVWQPIRTGGQPRLLAIENVQGYFEQIGRNTDYIIHPDEILAVNFVRMVNGDANLPTPRVISEMRKVLGRIEQGQR